MHANMPNAFFVSPVFNLPAASNSVIFLLDVAPPYIALSTLHKKMIRLLPVGCMRHKFSVWES